MVELMGLDKTKLRALLRLRRQLMLRQFSRERGRIVVAVIVILFALPYVLGATVFTAVSYLRLPDPWPAELLGGVLVGLWLLWLVFPVVFASLNEELDITRLLVYPLSRRDLVASAFLGTLFDYPTYLMLPLFGAVFVGWGFTLAFPAVLVAILLCYGHMVLIGQLVVTTLGGVLQSRRFRDAAIIVSALFGSSCYFLQSGLGRLIEELGQNVSEGKLLSVRPLKALQWLPTGAAARAIERASAGQWAASLAWLLYCAAWLLLLTWAWWRLVVRLTTGGGFLLSLPPRAPAPKRERVRTPAGRNLLAWLPPDIAQLALKELKSAARIPRRRVGVLQGALMPFIFIGATLLSGDGGPALPPGLGAVLPFYALYLAWASTQNVLGWEGPGLALLLLTPVPRQRIFLAKGLALMLILALPFLVLSGLVIGLARDWQSVLGALTGLNVALAALAVTAVASVLFPIPIKLEGKRLRRTSSGGSCATALAYMFVVPSAIGVVCLPVGVPLALAVGLDRAWMGVVGVLVGAVYAGVVFWLGTRLAGRLLLRREAEVWAALQVPGEDGG